MNHAPISYHHGSFDYFAGNVRPETRLATHSAGRLLQGDLMLRDLADLGVEDDDLYFVLDLQRFAAAAAASSG